MVSSTRRYAYGRRTDWARIKRGSFLACSRDTGYTWRKREKKTKKKNGRKEKRNDTTGHSVCKHVLKRVHEKGWMEGGREGGTYTCVQSVCVRQWLCARLQLLLFGYQLFSVIQYNKSRPKRSLHTFSPLFKNMSN